MKLTGRFKGIECTVVQDGNKKEDPTDAYFAGIMCPQCSSTSCKMTGKVDEILERHYTCQECNCKFRAVPKGVKYKKKYDEMTDDEQTEYIKKIGNRICVGWIIWFVLGFIMWRLQTIGKDGDYTITHTFGGWVFLSSLILFGLFLIAAIVLEFASD